MAQACQTGAAPRVLVLGSSGRVGTLLRAAWALEDTGIEFTFQTTDAVLRPSGSGAQRGETGPFDCMIVLSGVVPKPDADFTRNSVIGTASLLAAARMGIKTVFLASTSAVYGVHQQTPFHEADQPHPVNDYGRSKLAMEVACRAQATAAGIRLCCLRIGNVAGADALLCNAAQLPQGGTLALDVFAGQGTPVRSYIGPHSLAQVLCTLVHIRDSVPELLNIAAPDPVSMGALAQAAAVPVALHPAPPAAHQSITLECSALAALHRFAPHDSDPAEMVAQWSRLRSL